MTEHDGRRWVIVGALFATLFLIWGPLNAGGVFFVPVITHFGWSRGFFSLLVGVGPLAAGVSSPAAGWLMDRIDARKVMIAGASMVALGYVALSRANSALEFLLIFILLGVGVTASTIIPSALVITNWFNENRGLALGIAFAGMPLGGTAITIYANYVVQHYGFRAGYLAMAVPIAVIVIPLIIAFVRTRSDAQVSSGVSPTAGELAVPGLELREAFRSWSFWMIAIAVLLFAAADVGIRVHGYLADSFGGRLMLTAVFLTASAGIATLLGAAHFASIAMFIVVFGLVRETHLLPLVIGESLGIRRLGSILGFLALFATIGFAAGPAIAGRIFDGTGSYSGAWVLFMAMALVSALAMRATLPLRQETSRIAEERYDVA